MCIPRSKRIIRDRDASVRRGARARNRSAFGMTFSSGSCRSAAGNVQVFGFRPKSGRIIIISMALFCFSFVDMSIGFEIYINQIVSNEENKIKNCRF